MKISESQLDDIRRTPRQATVEEVADLADDLLVARLETDRARRAADSALRQLRNLDARLQSTSKLLNDILFHLPPQAVKLEDGRVLIFKDPDPARTLELIQGALQRVVDATQSAELVDISRLNVTLSIPGHPPMPLEGIAADDAFDYTPPGGSFFGEP